ncbi:MAG: DNA methyltransferase, partial [Pseudomonadota bacterium]
TGWVSGYQVRFVHPGLENPLILVLLNGAPSFSFTLYFVFPDTFISKPTFRDETMNEILRDLKIEIIPIDALKPYARNARKHSKKQIAQIADSMREFGWTLPILIDEHKNIIAGHGRVEAAKLLKVKNGPVIRIEGLSEQQIKLLRITDNKLAENSEWDFEALKLEISELLDGELNIDPRVTGFEMAEFDILLGESADEEAGKDEIVASDFEGPTIARPDDLFILDGRHRLFCGSALEERSYQTLMDGAQACFCFTDPPYNVPIDGNVSGLGRKKHGDFSMASGEMSREQFTTFLADSFRLIAANSVGGAIIDVCMDYKHMIEVITAGEGAFGELKNVCVWTKRNGGMGSLYRSAHEFVLVFKSGKGKHTNNVQLGRYGRNRTNVWPYAGVNSFGSNRAAALAMHPTVKPTALVADAILDCSNHKDIVLDPFAGSGTIFIAAHRTKRRAYAIELDPNYVDVCLRRFRRVTGIDPVHAQSGQKLCDMENERNQQGSDFQSGEK